MGKPWLIGTLMAAIALAALMYGAHRTREHDRKLSERKARLIADIRQQEAEFVEAYGKLSWDRPGLGEAPAEGDADGYRAEAVRLLKDLPVRVRACLGWVDYRYAEPCEVFPDLPVHATRVTPRLVEETIVATQPIIEQLERSVAAPMTPRELLMRPEVAVDLASLNALSYVLQLHATAAMRRGDFDRATRLGCVLHRLGGDVAFHGDPVARGAGMAIRGRAQTLLMSLPAMGALSSRARSQIEAELDRPRDTKAEMVLSTRYSGMQFRGHLLDVIEGRADPADPEIGTAFTQIFGDRIEAVWSLEQEIVAALSMPTPTSQRTAVAELLDAAESAEEEEKLFAVGVHMPTQFTLLLTHQDEGRLELLRTTLAVLRHRDRFGDLRDSIAALDPDEFIEFDEPIDPFMGNPHEFSRGRLWVAATEDGTSDELIEGPNSPHYVSQRDGRGYPNPTVVFWDLKLGNVGWRDETSPQKRKQVEAELARILDADAQDRLAEYGIDAAPRLISEFARIEQAPGFDSPEGQQQVQALDAILRRIDGHMELRWLHWPEPVNSAATAGMLAERWTNWWRQGFEALAPWSECER